MDQIKITFHIHSLIRRVHRLWHQWYFFGIVSFILGVSATENHCTVTSIEENDIINQNIYAILGILLITRDKRSMKYSFMYKNVDVYDSK